MTYTNLMTAVEDGIGLVRLARESKRNALSEALRDELVSVFDGYAADDDVRVVLLTGGPVVFSAGFDLREVATTRFATFGYRVDEYNEAVYGFPKPIVAAVAGPALAGGCDLALAADIIVAADDAVFGHPEVEFGAVPSMALMAPRVGESRAADLAMTGRRIDAAEALRIGLVDRVVPAADLDEASRAVAADLARRTGATLKALRAAAWDGRDVPAALRREFELSAAAVLDPENVSRLESYLARLSGS